MIHLKDETKSSKIKCNRWNRGFVYTSDDLSKVTCRTCKGERAANRYEAVEIKENLVGKVLHKSWGYNMTMNTYYLITGQSAKSVEAIEIGSKVTEVTGYLSGREVPDRSTVVGKEAYRFFAKGKDGVVGHFKGGHLAHSKTFWLHDDSNANYFNHCD